LILEFIMHKSIPALCATLLITLAPAAVANPTPGEQKARSCAACHGMNGISLNPGAPHLAGQPKMYLVEQLKNYRSGKRDNAVMAVIAKPLTDDDIYDVSTWYSSIAIEAKTP
jgi:cytochrome c553